MSKQELFEEVAKRTSLSKKATADCINAAIDVIVETTAKGESVSILGFGTFATTQRAERMGRNPKTKEPIKIPATTAPTFKAGKSFKDAVKAGKK